MRLRIWAFFLIFTFCACSTPDQRISKNQAEFDSLPAHDRKLIRAGDIDSGFTEAEVLLAKGEPSSRETHWQADHQVSVWTYTHKEIQQVPSAPGEGSLSAPFGFPVPGPQPIQTQPTVTSEVAVLVVHFTDGHVTDWQAPR
jgi:hypothetical protein